MSQARSKARETALQALYQWQLTHHSFSEADDRQFLEDKRLFLHQEIHYSEDYAKQIGDNLKNYAEQRAYLQEELVGLQGDIAALADEAELLRGNYLDGVHRSYFSRIYHGVVCHVADLDALIGEYADRPVEQMGQMERAILRIGTFELVHCLDVPCKVVLNEAINLAKVFGAQDGHKYVNGILDKIAKQQRSVEMRGKK